MAAPAKAPESTSPPQPAVPTVPAVPAVDVQPRVELAISGMRCAGCADTIGAALKQVPGVASADVSFAAGLALVRGESPELSSPASVARLVAAVRAAGYDAMPAGATAERAAWLAELRAAALAAALAIVAWLVHHFGGPGDESAGHAPSRATTWTGALLAVAAVVGPGASFLRGALQGLKTRRGTMDLLVAIGASAAALSSVLVALKLLPHEFDHGHAAVWLVAFLRVGKLLEARVRARASSSLLSLLDTLPSRARRLVDGVEQECDAGALHPGDRIVVLPAERIPADGVVVAGRSHVDEAAVTGEPMPVAMETGARVLAGSINRDGRLVIEVTAAGTATQLGQMAALVRRAVTERAPVVSLTDRIAARFVPAVLALAALTAIGWALAGASAATVVARALSTIVISCPCALALATPTAVLAGTNAALKRGVLAKDAGVFEALARVRVVLFDKTGTLTLGRPTVGHALIDRLRESEVAEVAGLARASRHPAAQALAAALAARTREEVALEDVVEEPGRGVRARVGSSTGHELALGRPEWVAGPAAAELPDAGDATVVAFARDGVLRAAWTLVDPIDPNAREVVAALLRRRLDVAIVTGDRRAAASAVAAQLHVLQDHVHAECSPVRKAEIVTEHERAGSPVLFVGDGFNDAAALAAASVGAAMGAGESGGGTDLARAAGRLILLRGELPDVLVALDVAKATVRTIAQNLLLAVAYNVVAIPWAMGLLARFGVVSPEPSTAGLAMAASSLAVVLNAFRLSLASARFGSRR